MHSDVTTGRWERVVGALLLLVCAAGIGGCADKLAGPKHSWYSLPPQQDPQGGWAALSSTDFRVIDPQSNWSCYSDATRRLKDVQIVELPAADLTKLLSGKASKDLGLATTRPNDGTRAYLVRGVACGLHPDWCGVWTDATGESIWIHQATESPESALAVVTEKQKPLPVVVFLKRKPDRIYVTALDTRTSPMDRRKLLR